VAALVEALDAFPHRRRVLVFTPSNRRDDDVLAMGRIIGDGFDRVFLYLDEGNSDRADGELSALLCRGIAAGKRDPETAALRGELATIEAALADRQSGDLLVLGVDSIEEALTFVRARLGM
jgi:cyanophycin synthetase